MFEVLIHLRTFVRRKNLTDTRSEVIVSPMAQREWDLEEGHCNVRVLLKTPFWSRVKLPDDSAPVIGLTITFVENDSVFGEIAGGWGDEFAWELKVSGVMVDAEGEDGGSTSE